MDKSDLLKEIGQGGAGSTTTIGTKHLGDLLETLLVAAVGRLTEYDAGAGDLSGQNLEDGLGNSLFQHNYVNGAAANTNIAISGITTSDTVKAIVRYVGVRASTPSLERVTYIDPSQVTISADNISLPIDTSEDALLVIWIDADNY